MKYQYDDGGRSKAGYKGETSDCVTRAIAIAARIPYQKVYDDLNTLALSEKIGKRKKKKSNSRTGVYKSTYEKYISSLGGKWIPVMTIGSGCKMHLRESEIPEGRIIARLSKHLTCIINKTIYDIYNPERDGNRCVYGYWIFD